MVEQKRGIFRAVVKAVRSLTKDHTGQDILNAKRLLAGEITPEDREQYKIGEISRIIAGTSSTMRICAASTDHLSLLPLESIGIIQELEKLPDEKIDEIIRQQAAEKLARWQQANPPPRI